MSPTADPVNWLFLAELIVVVIVTSAFLFYWNRLFGGLLAAVIRLISWRLFNAYIVIGSFQISPLAGRIAFRDVEYHSSNISVRALHGHITFRYWMFRVRQEGDSTSNNPKRAKLPCRIAVQAQGVEAFFYNRTPAYDAIVERMKKHEKQACGEDLTPESSSTAAGAGPSTARFRKGRPASMSRDESKDTMETTKHVPSQSGTGDHTYPPAKREDSNVNAENKVENGISWLHEALPLELKILTGSVVLGSDATPMVLIIDFKRAEGTVEVSEPRSQSDLYKMSYNLALSDVSILTRSNLDYSGPLLAHGKRAYNEMLAREPRLAQEPPSAISARSGFHWLAKRFPFLYDPRLSAPPVAGLPTDKIWKGLARYRVDDPQESGGVRREEREYAKVTTLLHTRSLDLVYYSDMPGPVPDPSEARDIDLNDKVGNIEPPPDYGVDIVLHGGAINYGPWADRQRVALQSAFAPSIFFDTEPRTRLKPGETRIHTTLTVNVTMTEKTSLRIPTREPSKDWMYEGAKPDVERRYGWLEVFVGPNSSITYTQAQVATQHGYDSMLVLHLDSLEMSSSVNLQSFIMAKACKLSMTMPVPLVWNAQRNWGIDVTLDTPEILLLREHVNLISDLSRDWSSGAAGDFHHFVPMHYNFRLALVKYAVHLFINDFNIVDMPRSRDHNAFLNIVGPRLDSYVAVSSTRYRPEFSVIPFSVDAKDAKVELSIPAWDTHRSFGKPELEVGKIGDIKISGSYRYYATPQPDHQEKLRLNVEAEKVAFKALGWAVRRIFCVKDNYFGNFTQFSTMQEYLEKFDHGPDSVGDPIMQKYRPGRSDPFGVHLTLDVRDSLIVMSDEFYGSEHGIAIPVPQLQLDLKNNEFQMDMSLDAAPTYAVACERLDDSYNFVSAPLARSQDVVFVEGIVIKANRLFGPQPRATTYFCLWELSFSRVSAFLSPQFAATLAAVGSAVGYNFVDPDNAPASIYIPQTPHDATFVKLSVDHVTALVSSGSSAVAVELPHGVFIDTSSMASKTCRSNLGIAIPAIKAHVLQQPAGHKRWEPIGSFGTGLAVDIYKVPKGWQEEAAEQQAFLQEQDEPTMRVGYLYGVADDPVSGRHVQSVYAPKPRSASMSWTADSSDESDYEYESSTAGSSSGFDSLPSARLPRTPRRKRSVSTIRRPDWSRDNSSIGDESDSVSSTSSHSSFSSTNKSPEDDVADMPTILEERMQWFQKVNERASRLFDRSGPLPSAQGGGGDVPYVPLTITDGSIFRISVDKTTVEVNPDTVRAAADVGGAMGAVDVRPEILLDQLLSYHVSECQKDIRKRSSKMYDITAPVVDLRVVLGTFNQPEGLTHLALNGSSVRVVQTPIPDSDSESMDATVDVQQATATLWRHHEDNVIDISLLDVPDLNLESSRDKLFPFALLTTVNLGATYHQQTGQRTFQLKGSDACLRVTTPNVVSVTTMLDEWKSVITNLPKHKKSLTHADLIYDLLSDAIESGITNAQPSYANEGSYGLHFQDRRDIRRDPGWAELGRLRQWLRLLRNNPAREQRPPLVDMVRFVVDEASRVEESMGLNHQMIISQPYFQKAFGKDLRKAGILSVPRVDTSLGIFINVEAVEIRHYGRPLEGGAITSSYIRVEGTSLSTQTNVTWVHDGPIESVRALITVRQFTIDLRNSFISALSALLTHVDTHRKEIKEMRVVQTANHASTVVFDVHLGQFSASVTGGGLRFDTTIDGAQGSGTIEKAEGAQSHSHQSVLFNCLGIQSVLRQSLQAEAEGRTLILTAVRGVRCSGDSSFNSGDVDAGSTRLLLGVDSFEFDSRPQLKAFYDFGQDWRETHYPLYEPSIQHLKDVLARKQASTAAMPALTPQSPVKPKLKQIIKSMVVDLYLGSVRMQVRAAKGLWLGWDMGQVYATRQGSSDHVQFGLRVDPQTVGAYTTAKRVRNKDSSIIRLPSITATGTYRTANRHSQLTALVNLGMFTGILKPAVLDRLLSLHQRLGNDVIEVIREYRPQKPVTVPVDKLEGPGQRFVFRLQGSVAGVRVGFRADDVPTTLMFEALELNGSAANADTKALQWTAKANHVGLSLIRMRDAQEYQSAQPLSGTRSVSMMFDIAAQEIPGTDKQPSKLSITLSRVHTVMHVLALSEIGDLIRSWSADIAVLREVHAAEMAEVKEQTTRLVKKLEKLEANSLHPESSSPSLLERNNNMALESWFASRLSTIEVSGIGVAIPLAEGASVDIRSSSVRGGGPALLFSIRGISLTTSRNETARFRVVQTSLQFVDKFDSSVPDHFIGQFHPSTNRMVLPSIDAEAQMSSTPEAWNVSAHCSATDFRVSLTPDVADGIARLGDLYDHGKATLEALERDYRAEWAQVDKDESIAVKYDEHVEAAASTRNQQQLIVRVSLRFDSGVVELRNNSAAEQPVLPGSPGSKLKGRRGRHPDTFTLPTVSIWSDYSGAKYTEDPESENVRTLLFNMAVHESRNVLHPTILPFLVEIVNRAEQRAKTRVSPTPPPRPPTPEASPMPITERALDVIEGSPTGRLRLRITLRIDRSELRLSCAPDSNAYMDLRWESGGFVASTLLGGKDTTTLAGSVSGVTAYLSNEYAEQNRGCMEAGAKDMAFSVTLCSGDPEQRGLSIVVDTQVSVQFRLEAFSACLIFMAVWVDNAPKFDLGGLKSDTTAAPSLPMTASNKLGIAVLVRFRSVDFDANVAVTQARLEMTPIVIRTVSNGEQVEVDVDLGVTQITAQGDISGDVRSEHLKFHTVRRSSRATDASDPTVLRMSIDAGDLRGNLFIGDMNIVRFQLMPSTVTLDDDWRAVGADGSGQVKLDFIVNCGSFFGVLRLPAIPRLLGHFYMIFDLLESQNKIAAQRSEMFKTRMKREVDDATPTTTVTLPVAKVTPQMSDTLDPSAPRKSTSPSPAHVKTAQVMRFALTGIDIGIFSDDYDDGTVADFYRFFIGKVHADLKRQESEGGKPMRDLELHVAFVEWQTSDGTRATRLERRDMSAHELIEAAMKTGHRDVVVLPMMTLSMASTETPSPPAPPPSILDYDFDVVWGPTDGDIKILPNFFEAAFKSFRELLRGIDDQHLQRQRRRGIVRAVQGRKRKESEAKAPPQLVFQRRGTGPWNNPVPKLRALGETTGEAAMMIPRIKGAIGELPAYSHRFVTLPLEEAMDLLLKLYEGQLPDLAA